MALLSATTASANTGDLWISILSLPPEPNIKAFGIYVHCPQASSAQIELYEIVNLVAKNKIQEFTAAISKSNNVLNLKVAGTGASPLVDLNIDESKSTQIAPFSYTTTISLDPSIYVLTDHQKSLSSMIFNPAYPEDAEQPVWGENLTTCGD